MGFWSLGGKGWTGSSYKSDMAIDAVVATDGGVTTPPPLSGEQAAERGVPGFDTGDGGSGEGTDKVRIITNHRNFYRKLTS